MLVTTKDGDWGKGEPTPDHLEYRVIRGTDFTRARYGDLKAIPTRYLPERSVHRRTLQAGDVLIETAGGTSSRPTGRTMLVTQNLLDALGAPATCASFARFLRVRTELADPAYVYWYLQNMHARGEMSQHEVRHTGVGRFQYTKFAETQRIPLPPVEEQRAIAATLGALDSKIESNRRQRALLRSLGFAQYAGALEPESRVVALEDVTSSIARGVAPKYVDEHPGAPLVINQKCIRDGWVSTTPARRMQDRAVAPAKRAIGGDILVNSTGTGTLGRVARWHDGSIFVDSHVTVVKPDPTRSPPTVLAYALLGRETDIVGMSTGSTGQTELSPTRLASLTVALPSARAAGQLEPVLLELEDRSAQLASESDRLAALRDTLLPELLSGRLRTPAAQS